MTVVPAVAFVAHAGNQPMSDQQIAVGLTNVSAATIAVYDQPGPRLA